jgi:hypothetical protein
MPRDKGRRSGISNDAVPYEACDPWVEIVDDLRGKVEQVNLLELDMTD